jgi:hypothetical protein
VLGAVAKIVCPLPSRKRNRPDSMQRSFNSLHWPLSGSRYLEAKLDTRNRARRALGCTLKALRELQNRGRHSHLHLSDYPA